AECVGDGRWFVDRATGYAKERVVFNRPIGQNQGVQFPIARAHVNVEAADLMRIKAAELFDNGLACGSEANMAKLLAADASWEAAARGSWRALDQDRTARRLRLRARLRHGGQRAVELFRLAEPLQGIADARSQAASRRRPA